MVLLMMNCWINLSMGWSQSLATRFLRRTHKLLKKLVYLPNEFCELQTLLVEVAHIVNSVNLRIMPRWNWIIWTLVSSIANQKKVAKVTTTINLAQPALFAAKRATLHKNAGTIHLNHPLLMLLTTHKDLGDARYTFQGIIADPRHPTDQFMPPTLSSMTTKYPNTLLMVQLVAICYQHIIHHQDLHLVLINAPQLPGTLQKTEIGTTRTLKPTWSEKNLFVIWLCCFWFSPSSYILQWAHG